MGQENIGVVRQPLVGGSEVSLLMQEYLGLLTLGDATGTCSASLLRNDWAITAAHCIEARDAFGRPIPDPSRPGQFILVPIGSITLTANWGGVQQRQAAQVVTFRPYDVAIIRVTTPFTVFGGTNNYNRIIFQDGQFPYWGEYVPVNLVIFGRGINRFAQGSGASATPSQRDGLYRVGYAVSRRKDDLLYWYPNEAGSMIAGGDSGGPSFAWILGGYALVGVHSKAQTDCLPGYQCGTWAGPGPQPAGYNPWTWVSATPEAADAPIAPVLSQITSFIGPPPPIPPGPDEWTPPPPQFIGEFGRTPPNYRPIWLYAIQEDGVLLWYAKDTSASPWSGPKQIGSGWAGFRDVIPAGGNNMYGLTYEGKLLWYKHKGFNGGTFDWSGPVEVGYGWGFPKIFSGGDGIVYAIRDDGALLWYRHGGFKSGAGVETWSGPREVGSDWLQFVDVFSTGDGNIYAVKPDGELLLYQHTGYATGEPTWAITDSLTGSQARSVGRGWYGFRQIIPVGDGIILAINTDGKLLYYKHLGLVRVANQGVENPFIRRLREWEDRWEGPIEIGSGWQGFTKVFSLLPASPDPIR